MNLDDLTIGQARELSQLFVGSSVATTRRSLVAPTGRAVVVVDRGWIFAGDMSLTADGHLRLDAAVHVFGWQAIGFAKMLEEWRSDKVDLRPVAPVEIPLESVIFRVPVAAGWGRA